MGRLFAIPDIHGRRDLLELLLVKLRTDCALGLTTDKLIFLGDMIDRGPDAKGVLDIIRKLQVDHPNNVVVLKGNHEQMCLDALRTGRWNSIECWMWPGNGGPDTLKSFQAPLQDMGGWRQNAYQLVHVKKPIPDEYLDWMDGLKNFHEEPGFFFSHAPVPKEKDRPVMLRGKPFTDYELTWTYFEDERGKSRHHTDKDGNKLVGVCGHIHRLNRGLFTPRYYKHYLFLDAGCGCSEKAPLVCTEVTQRIPIEIWPPGVTPIIHKRRHYIPAQPARPSLWDDPV